MVNFNNLGDALEIAVTRNCIDEVCQLYGLPVYYLSKTHVNKSEFFGEDDMTKYPNAVEIYLLPQNPREFEGGGQIVAKFNLQELYTITMFTEMNRFLAVVGKSAPDNDDLVYIPTMSKWFQVTYSDTDDPDCAFFWNGQLQAYKINLMKYQYSHESITSTTITALSPSVLPTTTNSSTTDKTNIDNTKEMIIDEFDKLLDEIE